VKDIIEVAIVGAGPYGLSIAARLRERGVPLRIFGSAMETWRHHMPAGMHLKSDGFASNLYDHNVGYTLATHCAEHGLAYHESKMPVPLETFVDYGLAFQARLVPGLEDKVVAGLRRAAAGGFELTLADGERVRAARVVLATGINHFAHVPPELAALPAQLCSHASAWHDLSGLAQRRVAVIGGGASALDLAALLHRAGAVVSLISRHPLEFHAPPGERPRSLLARLRKPHLGLGMSLRSTIYTLFPNLFHYLPRPLRLRIVRRHLGPAGGWFIRDGVVGKVAMHAGFSLRNATAGANVVDLHFGDADGQSLHLQVDHVIAATGYQIDLKRLGFLDQGLLDQIELEARSPVLSRHFESTVPGLFFAGAAAANSFGPLLRFALGARFTSRRLSAHLDRVTRHQRGTDPVQALVQ
jgi:thioredoxin reductase